MEIGQTVYEVFKRWWSFPSLTARTITHKKTTTETSSANPTQTTVEYGYTEGGEVKYMENKVIYMNKQTALNAYIEAHNRQAKKRQDELQIEIECFEVLCKKWED